MRFAVVVEELLLVFRLAGVVDVGSVFEWTEEEVKVCVVLIVVYLIHVVLIELEVG